MSSSSVDLTSFATAALTFVLIGQTQTATMLLDEYSSHTIMNEPIAHYSEELLSSKLDRSYFSEFCTIERNYKTEILEGFISKFSSSMKDLEPEFENVLNKNFMELLS
ncbi:MAG: hypothetical protein K9L73_03805 [Spirochaetia bacterium]|nr:hypothetical protein [Spirochaetia bacterium]